MQEFDVYDRQSGSFIVKFEETYEGYLLKNVCCQNTRM